jgi:hypothetical protein
VSRSWCAPQDPPVIASVSENAEVNSQSHCANPPARYLSGLDVGCMRILGKLEMTMKTLVNMCISGILALVAISGQAFAQGTTTPEARLKEKNITLPVVPPPVANYVDSVQVGKLLFLSGNTADAQWKFKGKVGKDITVQEGYETARQVGLIMLAKVRNAL